MARRDHKIVDDLARELRLPCPPARVVSLVPSLTETICWLGAADSLVAVTRYCEEPADVVRSLPKVGGTKNPACDEIIALAPDVVLVNSEENRREDVDNLLDAGLTVYVSYPETVREAARSIERIGTLMERQGRAAALANEIEEERQKSISRPHRRFRTFCPIWRNPWMSFNRQTYGHDLIFCSGADNLTADYTERYPTVGLEEIARDAPEVILLPDEPYRFQQRHLADLQPLAGTPAWRDKRSHFVDGKALFWYGPRTPAALKLLRGLLR